MENEREMFRYGPDPYFVAYAVVLLIPEIIGLAINGLNEKSIFGKIPYWLLTCMVVSMLASLITGVAFVNNKNNDRKLKKIYLIVVLVISVAYIVMASIALTMMYGNTTFPIILIAIGFSGLLIISIFRKNWITCSLAIISKTSFANEG